METLKVLMISSDRKILEENSAVSERMKEYGSLVKELHIVVLSKSSLGFKEKQLNSNVWVYPTNSFSRWLYVHDAARIGKRLIKDKGFIRGLSVITTQDPFESGLAGLGVKNKWRIPLEVQLHTDPFSSYFTGFLNFLRKRIAKRVLRHADTVRVVTENLKERLSKMTRAKINVLPIYIDAEYIDNAKVSFDVHERFGGHFILLAASRLTHEKNLSLAIRALAIVHKTYKDTRLIIVGDGPQKARLKLLVHQLGLKHAVIFTGWQDDLISFYKTANAFIQTSLFEGYGMSLIEAGLSGLPILTTPVGIAKDLENGKDAYIYPAGHPELFAEGIIDLIDHNHKREVLRTNIMHTLKTKLMPKADYLSRIKGLWEETARAVE